VRPIYVCRDDLKIRETGAGLEQTKEAALKFSSLVILSILTLSVVGIATSQASGTSASACDSAVIAQKVADAPLPALATVQNARTFTESSSAYQNAIKGYSENFTSAGDEASVNFSSCTASWTGFDLHYSLMAANGSEYVLTIGSNPMTETLSSPIIIPVTAASIETVYSTTYSGYAVATSSNPIVDNDTVPYASADWYLPTVTGNSTICGDTTSTSPHICQLAVWTGLQNSTYLGENRVPPTGSGEVIQTGTSSEVHCVSGGCLSTYFAWYEYLMGNSAGTIVRNTGQLPCSYTMSGGDFIEGIVGRGDLVNGSSSSVYVSVVIDSSHSGDNTCYFKWTNSKNICSSHSCDISGKEYFADYFGETPQCGSSCSYALPKFTIPHNDNLFDYLGITSGSQGAYPDYNDGYYMYAWMENSGLNNTSVTPMSEYCCGSTYGYFNETFLHSAGTGF
jgi:hypothetical protein